MNSLDVELDNELEHDRKSLFSAGLESRLEVIGNITTLIFLISGCERRIKYRDGRRERHEP